MNMHDCLIITGLEYRCSIGAYNWEKEILQKVFIDLELNCNVSHYSNNLADALDYAKVNTFLSEEIQKQHFCLIEELANHLANALHTAFGILSIRLCVHKPHALSNAKDVAIRIHRQF